MSNIPATTLLIDAGNTRLKWALLHAGELTEMGSLIHQGINLDAEIHERWAKFSLSAKRPRRIVMANVAGHKIADAVIRWYGETLDAVSAEDQLIDVVAHASAFGVVNAYAEPAKLGADRWAALVAARHFIEGPVCIVDCGTAITVDVLSSDGVHQGGIILPGTSMMKHSLINNTQYIKNVDSPTNHYLGTDTQSGVQAGVLAAGSGGINQVMQFARQIINQPVTGIITGGDAQALLPRLQDDFRHEPDWVIKGLGVIAEYKS